MDHRHTMLHRLSPKCVFNWQTAHKYSFRAVIYGPGWFFFLFIFVNAGEDNLMCVKFVDSSHKAQTVQKEIEHSSETRSSIAAKRIKCFFIYIANGWGGGEILLSQNSSILLHAVKNTLNIDWNNVQCKTVPLSAWNSTNTGSNLKHLSFGLLNFRLVHNNYTVKIDDAPNW